uniref:Uncharacterized protein n=1 Tax=Riptortus pedestris TaxID=329032 RepID=R4WDZ6_RIPPE|nr:unknown secreted protein [Riptortus pedestris]
MKLSALYLYVSAFSLVSGIAGSPTGKGAVRSWSLLAKNETALPFEGSKLYEDGIGTVMPTASKDSIIVGNRPVEVGKKLDFASIIVAPYKPCGAGMKRANGVCRTVYS